MNEKKLLSVDWTNKRRAEFVFEDFRLVQQIRQEVEKVRSTLIYNKTLSNKVD